MRTTEISPEGCTTERFTVPSPSMGREINAVVVLPPEYAEQPEKRYPILYTFHGMAAPHDTFAAMEPLRAALREKPMIVTCLDADAASFYLDSPFPQKVGRKPDEEKLVKSLFTTFFLDEFIPAIDRTYRVNAAQRMLTGFSMGGYGALHYYLSRPREFVAVSGLSGWYEDWSSLSPTMVSIIEKLVGPLAENRERYDAQDVFVRIRKQKAAGIPFAPIYQACGTEDFLLECSRGLCAFLKAEGIPCEYRETAGAHDWPYWRGASADLIDFHWRALTR